MYDLSFSKWSLQFYRKEDENEFNQQLVKNKIQAFHYLAIGYGITLLILFILLCVYQYGIMHILIIGGVVAITIGLLIMSLKCRNQIDIIFQLLFLVNIALTLFFARLSEISQQYMLGHSQCYIICALLQHIQYKLRIFYVIALIIIQFITLQVYESNVQTIITCFLACLLKIYSCHSEEFCQRQVHDINQKLERQKQLLSNCTNEYLFITNFDEENQSFKLNFTNKLTQNQLGINDDKTLQQFIRNSFILQDESQATACQFSQDKLNRSKKTSLEEYLFRQITISNELVQQVTVWYNINNNSYNQLKLNINLYDKFKQIFSIVSQQNDIQIIQNQHKHQVRMMKELIVGQQNLIVNQGLQLNNSLNNIQLNQNITKQLNLINYFNLITINQIKNNQLFLQIDKVYKSQQQFIQQFEISTFLDELFSKLSSIFEKNKIQLEYNQQLTKHFELNLNKDFLTQILINIFEYCFKYIQHNGIMSFKVKLHKNQNKQNEKQKFSPYDQRKSKYLDTLFYPQILSFTIKFISSFMLKPNTYKLEECNLETIKEFDFNYFITTVLLDILGPTNQIIIIQKSTIMNHNQDNILNQTNSESENYLSKIQFHIYTDQSLIDPSYYKYSIENIFLNLF